MLKIIDINTDSEYQSLRLEKDKDGLYPVPMMRCGVLPFFFHGNQIIWGCVKADRVGPTTITPPAGIQDILFVKNNRRFSLETGKPLPQLEDGFLQEFIGKSFRDEVYQQVIARFIENEFEVYLQNPLVTAIQETYEEHGLDLRKDVGLNRNLLNTLSQLPVQTLSGHRGATAQCFWLASLNSSEGIVLNETIKIENKIRRNFGRQFYERGCWGTTADFKRALQEENNLFLDSSISSQNISLIQDALDAYAETIEFLERIELLIRSNFKKTALSTRILSIFSKPQLKNEQIIKEALTIKTALKNISYDTWFVLDLDNTVMESVIELGSDQWFEILRNHSHTMVGNPDSDKFTFLIYAAVQAHVRTKTVELRMANIIKSLQDIGIPVFALTARDVAIKHETIRQLEAIGIDFSRNGINVNYSSYEKGVIFSSGENKGHIWRAFLEKCPNIPRSIVMLDDKKRHLERMLVVAKTLGINFTGLRYGFLDEKIAKFNMTLANDQLAYLKKYLPRDVQDAIERLQLVPHAFEPTSMEPALLSGFFNKNEQIESDDAEKKGCLPISY